MHLLNKQTKKKRKKIPKLKSSTENHEKCPLQFQTTHISCEVSQGEHTDSLPERNHVAQLGGQAAELIGRQVQVDQVGQLGDVRRDAGQVVVVDVQCCQVGQGP